MSSKVRLKSLRIAIATHVFATGPAQALQEYLIPRARAVIFIGHPFSYAGQKRSFLEHHREGRLERKIRSPLVVLPEILLYAKDLILNFFWGLFVLPKTDIFVGFDNLNAFAGIILKLAGKTDKVIYYVVDYAPERFNSAILNRVYLWLDSFCVRSAGQTWNLSPAMAQARHERGLKEKYKVKQIVVPMGTDPEINGAGEKGYDKDAIAFMGHLRQGQGLELLIESMPDLIKEFPHITLRIFGTGDIKKDLKDRARALNVDKQVRFYGYVEDHKELLGLLSKCALGVAPYSGGAGDFTRFADPGKVKAYLAAGLPVVMTGISHVAKEIEGSGCGIIIKHDKKELVNAVRKILKDGSLRSELRNNVKEASKKYSWDNIFEAAFKELLCARS